MQPECHPRVVPACTPAISQLLARYLLDNRMLSALAVRCSGGIFAPEIVLILAQVNLGIFAEPCTESVRVRQRLENTLRFGIQSDLHPYTVKGHGFIS